MPVPQDKIRNGSKVKDETGEATVIAEISSSVGTLVLLKRGDAVDVVPRDSLVDESSEAEYVEPVDPAVQPTLPESRPEPRPEPQNGGHE